MNIKSTVSVVSVAFVLSGCMATDRNTLALGSLGAIGGGLAGSQVGGGKGKLIATAGGSLLGAVLGAFVGNKFDTINHNQQAVIGLARSQQQMRNSRSQAGNHTTNIYQHGRLGGSGNQALDLSCRVERNYVICGSR